MHSDGLNVFLLNDSPELQPAIERIARHLKEHTDFPVESYFLSGIAKEFEDPANRPKRDLREGDVLIFLSRDESGAFNESFVRAYCERAIERKLVIFPVMRRNMREHRRSPWRRQLLELYCPIKLDFAMGNEALAGQASSAILSRIRLATAGTDLIGSPLEEPDVDALALLDALDEEIKVPSLMAVKAMEARLLPTAVNSLEVVNKKHSITPIIPYWMARMSLAQNSREEATRALIEASRAARLATFSDTPEDLERAALLLASKAAFTLGDEGSAHSYLQEAMAHPTSASDWVELARRHAEMQHAKNTLAALEKAFHLSPKAYYETKDGLDFSFIIPELIQLDSELRTRALAYTEPLLNSERAATERQADHQDAQPVEMDLWLQNVSVEEKNLPEIIDEGLSSIERQIVLFSDWVQDLVKSAEKHIELQKQISLLPEEKPPMPELDAMEKVLLKFSAQFQRKWADLEAAAENQVALRHQLSGEEAKLSRNLTTQLDTFLSALKNFEAAALGSPPVPVFTHSSEPQTGDLVAVSDDDDRWPTSKEILPEILKRYPTDKTASATARFLCRLTQTGESEGLVASRKAAYFRSQ